MAPPTCEAARLQALGHGLGRDWALAGWQLRQPSAGWLQLADGRYDMHYVAFVIDVLQNRFFGPSTAKSQLIWIKFCTHLLLYGIHLRADLDRVRRVGGSRPNQNDYVFCKAS